MTSFQGLPTQSKMSESTTPQASKALVEQGYDQIAPRYLEWVTNETHSPLRLTYLHKLLEFLPSNSKILELGCGAGIPCTQLLAKSHHVIGNDISSVQIELAKKHVPTASFIKGDMMKLEFEREGLTAVVAFYSIIHLPREEQSAMLSKIRTWLKDDGSILLNLGAVNNPGSTNENWLGGKMYWSGFDAETNVQMIKDAGFDILEQEIAQDVEDGRIVPFLWIIARKR